MQGDFTRNTFDPLKHFTRVLMQQGRVQLDADWNEQTAILLNYLQALAKDLIGAHGGEAGAFLLGAPTDENGKFKIPVGAGHYYVDGLLCENDLGKSITVEKGKSALVYLDVWERHVTYVETAPVPFDQTIPNIREVALGGPDTATRAQLVWQLKLKNLDESGLKSFNDLLKTFKSAKDDDSRRSSRSAIEEFFKTRNPKSEAQLAARVEPTTSTEPCNITPDARYRGAENQLYRVEMHKEGHAGTATFKWSRANGSAIFPILSSTATSVTLAHLGRDDRYGISHDDWVEYVDDDISLLQTANLLWQVDSIDSAAMSVKLTGTGSLKVNADKHPYLRRWDQAESLVEEAILPTATDPKGNEKWQTLENGVQIQFQPAAAGLQNFYRTGDYWLIPARTMTGNIEWPKENGQPVALLSQGIKHHYALLAAFGTDGTVATDLRMIIAPIAQPAKP